MKQSDLDIAVKVLDEEITNNDYPFAFGVLLTIVRSAALDNNLDLTRFDASVKSHLERTPKQIQFHERN